MEETRLGDYFVKGHHKFVHVAVVHCELKEVIYMMDVTENRTESSA